MHRQEIRRQPRHISGTSGRQSLEPWHGCHRHAGQSQAYLHSRHLFGSSLSLEVKSRIPQPIGATAHWCHSQGLNPGLSGSLTSGALSTKDLKMERNGSPPAERKVLLALSDSGTGAMGEGI